MKSNSHLHLFKILDNMRVNKYEVISKLLHIIHDMVLARSIISLDIQEEIKGK